MTPNDHRRRRRAAAVVLAVVGLLLWALIPAGVLLYPFVALRPWVHHPLIFGLSGCVVMAVAVVLGVRHPVLKVVGVVVLGLGAVGLAGLAWLASALREDLDEQARHPSPDGSMEVVEYAGWNIIDPTTELRLHTRNGLLSRENDLGCVNSDVERLDEIEWVGPRTLRIHLGRAGTVDVALDERGRPDRRVEAGC